MAKVGDNESLAKVNLYRVGVGQPLAATPADADGPTYCTNLKTSSRRGSPPTRPCSPAPHHRTRR
jgi:hypothetical protein